MKEPKFPGRNSHKSRFCSEAYQSDWTTNLDCIKLTYRMKIPDAAKRGLFNLWDEAGLSSWDSLLHRLAVGLTLIAATLVAVVTTWGVVRCWFPVISEAAEKLPQTSSINSGTLQWPDSSPLLLSANKYLSIVVDLNFDSSLGLDSDVAIVLGQRSFRIYSLAGYVEFPYPPSIPLYREVFKPWWNAWKDILPLFVGTLIGLTILALWSVANVTILAPVGLALAICTRRKTNLLTTILIGYFATAITSPALILAILSYILWGVELIQFIAVTSLHPTIALLLTLSITMLLPRKPEPNPFSIH